MMNSHLNRVAIMSRLWLVGLFLGFYLHDWDGMMIILQVYQYAHCVKDRLRDINMTDIGIYVDVWRSLNGRFQQRLIDPRVDVLTAEWSPFERTKWIMPLLSELTTWRAQLDNLQQNVLDDNRQASVAFVADFPGDLHLLPCLKSPLCRFILNAHLD